MSTTTPQASTTRQVSLEQLDPTTLVIADNVRLDPRLDKQFLASIRERGVLEPVVGHRTPDGTVVVEYGQRRTLAAREVGQATIPVIVSDTPPISGASPPVPSTVTGPALAPSSATMRRTRPSTCPANP